MARTAVSTRVVCDANNKPPAPTDLPLTNEKASARASAVRGISGECPPLPGNPEVSK